MAVLGTPNFNLPHTLASEMWAKTQTGSVVTALSGAMPMQFGSVDIMTFDTPPRAEYVAEGGDKAPTDGAFGLKTVVPHKVQITIRFNQEVQWADDDHQLGILKTMSDAGSVALSRALDLGILHGINPLTGLPAASIVGKLNDTTNRVEAAAPVGNVSLADIEVETAAGLVIAAGFSPTGIAFDPKYAWTLATARFVDGRKKFPDLGYGMNITAFEGLKAASSSTVSGMPEAADTKLRAMVGDWSLLRWGVQRVVPIEKIEFGDPDGQGDLKRKNQIALRMEVVYGWAWMSLDGFAAINDLV